MLFNQILTPLDILKHIEDLQKNNMEDDDAWELYYESYRSATSEMQRKAEEYKERYDIYPSNINYMEEAHESFGVFWVGIESWFFKIL